MMKAENQSRVVCDGYPTFYISKEGLVCTHRLSESDIPVWCSTGDDGLKAMNAITSHKINSVHYPRATLQQLIDVGLNGFAVKLLSESINQNQVTEIVKFRYGQVGITIEPIKE